MYSIRRFKYYLEALALYLSCWAYSELDGPGMPELKAALRSLLQVDQAAVARSSNPPESSFDRRPRREDW